MRKVHDILQVFLGAAPRSPLEPFIRPTLKRPADAPIPFAIIQWGQPGEYEYEIFCPFCAEAIGWHVTEPEIADTFGALAIAGGGLMALHREKCTRFGASRLEVVVTDVPLGTEHKPSGAA